MTYSLFDYIFFFRVFGEKVEAVDCGDAASAWISKYLKEDNCHIVFAAPGLDKRVVANGTLAPRYQRLAPDSALVCWHPFQSSPCLRMTI